MTNGFSSSMLQLLWNLKFPDIQTKPYQTTSATFKTTTWAVIDVNALRRQPDSFVSGLFWFFCKAWKRLHANFGIRDNHQLGWILIASLTKYFYRLPGLCLKFKVFRHGKVLKIRSKTWKSSWTRFLCYEIINRKLKLETQRALNFSCRCLMSFASSSPISIIKFISLANGIRLECN